jgi:hypothetical protein
VHLVLLEQGWAEGALGWYVPRLRWLVARRGKTLGPQVAVCKYDRKHFSILSGVSLRFVAGAQEIEARVLSPSTR